MTKAKIKTTVVSQATTMEGKPLGYVWLGTDRTTFDIKGKDGEIWVYEVEHDASLSKEEVSYRLRLLSEYMLVNHWTTRGALRRYEKATGLCSHPNKLPDVLKPLGIGWIFLKERRIYRKGRLESVRDFSEE